MQFHCFLASFIVFSAVSLLFSVTSLLIARSALGCSYNASFRRNPDPGYLSRASLPFPRCGR